MSPQLKSNARAYLLPCSAALALLLLCGLQAGCGGRQDTAPGPAAAGQRPGAADKETSRNKMRFSLTG